MYPDKFTLKDLEWQILTEAHNLDAFCCSDGDDSEVDDFFHREAKQYQFENMGTSYLFYFKDKIQSQNT